MSRAARAHVQACAGRTKRGAVSVSKTMAERRARGLGAGRARAGVEGKEHCPNLPPDSLHSLLSFQRSECACSSGRRSNILFFFFFL